MRWRRPAPIDVPKIWYERPSFYKPSRFAVCGPDQDVTWPAYSKTIDYELEFACVIGKAGRNIAKDKARDHIFGYTIFNDLSARDEQSHEMLSNLGPGKGKDFDNSNPIGPCIVTADEIPDPYALEMIVRVNGEERGRGNSREMGWKYEDCIAFVSRDETIHPGELFCSGTVGNGSGLEIGRYVEAGRGRRTRSRENRRTAQSHRTRLNYQREESMLQKIRRVVTGHNAAGKAVILFDDQAPNVNPLKGWPGAGVTEIWVTDEMPVSNDGPSDRSLRPMRHDPTPSGTIFPGGGNSAGKRRQHDRRQGHLRPTRQHASAERGGFRQASDHAQDRLRSIIWL